MGTYLEATQYNGIILHKDTDYPKTRYGFDHEYDPPRKYIYYYDNNGTVYQVYGDTTAQIDKTAAVHALQCIGCKAPDYYINLHGAVSPVRTERC